MNCVFLTTKILSEKIQNKRKGVACTTGVTYFVSTGYSPEYV